MIIKEKGADFICKEMRQTDYLFILKISKMGISVKTDLAWGNSFYLKDDPDQFEHSLTGVMIRPGGIDGKYVIKFMLSCMGEECEVYDFEASTERDEFKVMKRRENDDD